MLANHYISAVNKGFAQFLSYLAHPGMVPIAGVALAMLLSPHYISKGVFFTVMAYVFLGTYFFPLGMSIVLKKLGLIKSLRMEKASERRLPFITAALFYFITAQSLRSFPVPIYVAQYLFSGVLILGISLMLLSFTKISIHMAGMGALLALILHISAAYGLQLLLLMSLTILLAGSLGTARLVLKAHNSLEIYSGFLLGLVAVFMSFYFF